jgi:hypothetical protein
MNPAPEPHDHLNIKHRLTYRAKRLNGHAITHFKVLQLYRSPLPENSKMFSQRHSLTHLPGLFRYGERQNLFLAGSFLYAVYNIWGDKTWQE